MDEQQQTNTPGTAGETPARAANGPGSRARRWTIAGLMAATIAAVGGAFAWQGYAQAHGAGMGRFGWHGDMDPEAMGRRLEAMVGWVLADVDATPDQKSRITTIARGAVNDLAPMRQQHADARRKSLEMLAAPTIDRAQLERLRVEQMQLADTTTRRLSQALLDAAEVLNPDQRARLVNKWQQRHARRHSNRQG